MEHVTVAPRIKNLLYPLCVAAGICYGSMFSLVLALTGDLFGAEHIATNYGLLDLGTPSRYTCCMMGLLKVVSKGPYESY